MADQIALTLISYNAFKYIKILFMGSQCALTCAFYDANCLWYIWSCANHDIHQIARNTSVRYLPYIGYIGDKVDTVRKL